MNVHQKSLVVPDSHRAELARGDDQSTPAVFNHPLLSSQEIATSFRSLSVREAEICSLVVRRLSTAEMGTVLFVSPRTVEKHLENVFFKLEVRSRKQLRWLLGLGHPPGSGSEQR